MDHLCQLWKGCHNQIVVKKFFITGGRGHNDRQCRPIVSFGKDRIEAICNAGFTVWTEEEWEAAKEFREKYGFPEALPVELSHVT